MRGLRPNIVRIFLEMQSFFRRACAWRETLKTRRAVPKAETRMGICPKDYALARLADELVVDDGRG